MDSQEHHDRIGTQLSSMFTTNTTEGTVGGGSFTYTVSDMRTIKNNWLDLAESYRESLTNADRMTKVEPPAEDMASTFHADAANRSGESYKNYLEHNRDYCLQQAQLFQDATDDYLGVERTNVTEINNSGGRPGPQAGV
jgi:hypothetical protein